MTSKVLHMRLTLQSRKVFKSILPLKTYRSTDCIDTVFRKREIPFRTAVTVKSSKVLHMRLKGMRKIDILKSWYGIGRRLSLLIKEFEKVMEERISRQHQPGSDPYKLSK